MCNVPGCPVVDGLIGGICRKHYQTRYKLCKRHGFEATLDDLSKYDRLIVGKRNNNEKFSVAVEIFSGRTKKVKKIKKVNDILHMIGNMTDRQLVDNALKNCMMPLNARLRLRSYGK